MLTVELIRRGARYFPERTAVYFEDKSLTFNDEFLNAIRRWRVTST